MLFRQQAPTRRRLSTDTPVDGLKPAERLA
jgi:hypothetical protein